MVVKPLQFLSKDRRGLAQPGPEYLRIIYGPEYLLAENLDGLPPQRSRREAFARQQRVCPRNRSTRTVWPEGTLRRTHECVFGVLALESDPVDP